MEFHIPMTQQLESEVETMCNLSDYVEQRGVEKGIQQGIQQGIEQGIQQGIQQGIEQGIQQGIERGIQQGMKRGIDRINLLNIILLNANRMDDLKHASMDKKFQMELMEELLPKEVLD